MALSPETFDPTALPWKKLADGRPHRLKRGKHYVGSARAVQRAARAAAGEMDRAVVSSVEQMAKWEHIWLQFADQSIEEGEPCRCGGRRFARHHVQFGLCELCGRVTVLREPSEKLGPLPSVAGAVEQDPSDFESGSVTALRILSARGEEVERVPIDEEVILEGVYVAPSVRARITPQVTLRTGLVRVFAASSAQPYRLPHPGEYRFRMRIPPELLAPQTYEVELRVRVRRSETNRWGRGVRRGFEAYDPAKDKGGREGVVRPRFEWTTLDEHGMEVPEAPPKPPEPLDPDDEVIPGGG